MAKGVSSNWKPKEGIHYNCTVRITKFITNSTTWDKELFIFISDTIHNGKRILINLYETNNRTLNIYY